MDYFISKFMLATYWIAGTIFEHFLDPIKAIDVTFQKSCARGEDDANKKICWFVKHKGYIWKLEVNVGLDFEAQYLLPSYLRLFYDMKMLKKHINDHLKRLAKDDLDTKESNYLLMDDKNDNNMYTALLDRA